MLHTLTTDGPGARLDELVYAYDDNRNVGCATTCSATTPGRRPSPTTLSTDSIHLDPCRLDGSDIVRPTSTMTASVTCSARLSPAGRTQRHLSLRAERSPSSTSLCRVTGRGTPTMAPAAAPPARPHLDHLQPPEPAPADPAKRRHQHGVRVRRGWRPGVQAHQHLYPLLDCGPVRTHDHGRDPGTCTTSWPDGREVAQVTVTQAEPEGPVTGTDTRYIHPDGQGSAVLVTNEAGARVADTFYDPYGRRTDDKYDPLAGNVPVRPGYTGHRNDEEAGLIDMRGRVYDHETRRFLTPDPFVQAPLFSQSHNRYSYVWNNPATLIDPTVSSPKAPRGKCATPSAPTGAAGAATKGAA